MKKSLMIVLILLVALLFGCDYPEKSFQALSRQDIPTEVTMDFVLPRGVYAPFIWTSSNEDVLKIVEERHVQVFQQQEDVEVTIRARVNKKTEDFIITVLKVGSEATYMEQSRMALQELGFPQELKGPIEVPLKIGNISLEYSIYGTNRNVQIIEKMDGSLWIVPTMTTGNTYNTLVVKTFMDEEGQKVLVDSKTLAVTVVKDLERYHMYKQVFDDLKVVYQEKDNQYGVTKEFILPDHSSVKEDAEIKWTVPASPFLTLEENGKILVTNSTPYSQTVVLKVTIVIEEFPYLFDYLIVILPTE